MTFEESVRAYYKHRIHMEDGASFVEMLAFVEKQWGAFVTWIREQHPRKVVIEVRGGVAECTSQLTPDIEVEIIDHDNA